MAYRGINGYYPVRNPNKIINKNDLTLVDIPTLNEMFHINMNDFGGKVALIKYKSKLEQKVLSLIDNDPNIISWGYECIVIPYILDNKSHNYHVDIYVEKKGGIKELWEIKPYSIATKEPTTSSDMRDEYRKNDAKWLYAKEWCKTHNFIFRVITD